ncbi:MAG: D-alanyl-D-alanine carboxypeptidase [Clostridia bacterium]|nr:D-alanyl-D-alanine carboxypeptidase [Clostridia bacterium]
MKKFLFILSFFVLVFSSTGAMAFSLSAQSAILIDGATGEVIYEKNADKKMPMASTTKIMTAICTTENINSNVPIRVNSDAAGIEGSSIYLKAGEKITIKELLCGMLLNSGNDAATALALEVAGSVEKFSEIMNKTAIKIGANSTNFKNSSGLYDENHYTTARDLAKIAAYAMENPLIRWIVGLKEIKISNDGKGLRYLKNHNKLLWQYEGCTGIKTGYTKKCGRCLVSSAKRGSKELIAVTLNAPDDWRDHKILFDYGFKDENTPSSPASSGKENLPVKDVFTVLLNLTSKFLFTPLK